MTEIYLDYGQKLKILRMRAGITQQQLADRSGVSRAAIASLETGRRKPTLDTAELLAAALNVKISDFSTVVRKDDEERTVFV